MTNAYTVEVYKFDRRIKSGERLVEKTDYTDFSRFELVKMYNRNRLDPKKFRVVIQETFVTVRNSMTGEMVQERYDRPYYMSVASESYWAS